MCQAVWLAFNSIGHPMLKEQNYMEVQTQYLNVIQGKDTFHVKILKKSKCSSANRFSQPCSSLQ